MGYLLTYGILNQARNLNPGTPPFVIDSSLILFLDSGDSNSYPGSGTVWNDISGNSSREGNFSGQVSYGTDNSGVVSLGASQRKYDSSGNLLETIAKLGITAMAVDSSGNVYTNNLTANTSVAKYNSSGVLQWSANHGAVINSIAVDTSGNVYIGGVRTSNLTTRKYNSSGTLQWSVDHGANVNSVAVDSSTGDVYIGGVRTSNLTTRKYNSSGTLQWSVDFGAAVNSVAVLPNGNICTGGVRVTSGGSRTIRVYNSSNTIQWSADHGATVRSVATDSSNNVYSGGLASSSLTTRKYNSSGTLQWSVNHGDQVNSVSVDSSDNVYTGGVASSSLTTRKYDSSGTLQWSVNQGATVNVVTADLSNVLYAGSALIDSGVVNISPNLTSFSSTDPHSYFVFLRMDSYNTGAYSWLINNGSSTNGTSIILHKDGSVPTRGALSFFYNGGNNLLSGFGLGTAPNYTDTTLIEEGKWYSLATVYDSSAVTYYVNGVSMGTLSITASPNFSSGNLNPRLGAWQNGSFLLRGGIPVAAVYSKALTSAEVLQNHDAFKSRYGL
jgi:hypothetical protein